MEKEGEMMIVAKCEEDIVRHAEGRGSLDCGLKAYRAGKMVLLCSPEDDTGEVVGYVEGIK